MIKTYEDGRREGYQAGFKAGHEQGFIAGRMAAISEQGRIERRTLSGQVLQGPEEEHELPDDQRGTDLGEDRAERD